MCCNAALSQSPAHALAVYCQSAPLCLPAFLPTCCLLSSPEEFNKERNLFVWASVVHQGHATAIKSLGWGSGWGRLSSTVFTDLGDYWSSELLIFFRKKLRLVVIRGGRFPETSRCSWGDWVRLRPAFSVSPYQGACAWVWGLKARL